MAKFRCLKCGYKYQSFPGPTQCPKCNSLYVKWINYKEMELKWIKEGVYEYASITST